MAAYLLGIDNGGTVVKAAIYDPDGREVAVAGVKTETLFPRPGHIERDMDGLWSANARVIGESIRRAGIDAADIAGVAATGHGNGLYLVGRSGRPAWNGILSSDTRAGGRVQGWYRDGTFERALPKTCQSIWAAQPAALLAWFREHEPEALERTRWIFMCKDYIRYRLTGEAGAEITDYSGTSLMNVRTLRYDPQLLELFGIAAFADRLPPLRRSAEICGQVTEEAAEATGLKAGTPVAGGLFDITACAIATGITDPGRLCLVAGTWSINEYISPAPVESPDLFMTSVYCLPGYWLTMEGSATSASNLEWFVSQLMDGESARAQAAGRPIYELCSEMAGSVEARDCEVVFLPFLYGSNAGPNAASCFIGMRGWHTKAHLLRAIFEGVVFSHRTHVDRLMAWRGPPEAARIAGGAAKSPVWVQMFADALQLPIEIAANEELGAMGAAICAGAGAGLFASIPQAVERMVKISRVVEPDPASREIYDGKYARYRAFVEALRAVWDR